MAIRAFLFDFDGTLADSFDAIAASTNHVRAAYGLAPLSRDDVRKEVGFGIVKLLEKLVPSAPIDAAKTLYSEHHVTVMPTMTKLLPQVADTLRTLSERGKKLAVCSNKKTEFTRDLVGLLGIAGYFSVILGPDDVPSPKPDPSMLLEAMRRLKVSAAESIYVGDMYVDAEAGKAAGISTWFVPGEESNRGPKLHAVPDRVMASFAELLEVK